MCQVKISNAFFNHGYDYFASHGYDYFAVDCYNYCNFGYCRANLNKQMIQSKKKSFLFSFLSFSVKK